MLLERLKNSRVILFIGILVTILVSLLSTLTSSICRAADEKIWYVHDAIEP